MEKSLNVMVARDRAVLAEMMLDLFIKAAEKSLAEREWFAFAIPGGRTPRAFFELLAEDEHARQLSWEKVHVFWTDERCVPPDSTESNFRLAQETFLLKLPIPEDNIHRIGGENPDPHFEADLYEGIIRQTLGTAFGQLPVFDLIILGMGADGHIASLFPGSAEEMEDKRGVTATERLHAGFQRISLTAPVIASARQIIVLVAGADKKEKIAEVFGTPRDEQFKYVYPVHHLWPVQEKVVWLLDQEAAGEDRT